MGIGLRGGFEKREVEVLESRLLIGDQAQVDREGLWHGRLIQAFGPSFAIGLVGNLLADRGQVVLAVGMLYMGQEFRTFAHQVGAAPEQVAGGAPLGRIDRGLWEHATAQQSSNLLRIDLVMFGLAAVDGFHLEGVSPLATTAQPRREIPRVGVMEPTSQARPGAPYLCLSAGLRDLGYVKGQTILPIAMPRGKPTDSPLWSLGCSRSLEAAVAAMVHGSADVLMIMESPLFAAHRQQLLALALQPRLPTMLYERHYAVGGCPSHPAMAATPACGPTQRLAASR